MWAVVVYDAGLRKATSQGASRIKPGYYLDSVFQGKQVDCDVAVEAAKQAAQGETGYVSHFAAPITAGGRKLFVPLKKGEVKPKYDVWLYSRNYEGFREYEVKLAHRHRDKPPPEAPAPPDEEWESALVAEDWMYFHL